MLITLQWCYFIFGRVVVCVNVFSLAFHAVTSFQLFRMDAFIFRNLHAFFFQAGDRAHCKKRNSVFPRLWWATEMSIKLSFFLLALKTYRCHLSKQANGKSSTKFACTLTQGLRMIWPKSTGRDGETNLRAQAAKLANVLLNGATEDDIWNVISNNQQNAVITYKRNYRHDFQRMNTL